MAIVLNITHCNGNGLNIPHCNGNSFVKKCDMLYGPVCKFTVEESEISALFMHGRK